MARARVLPTARKVVRIGDSKGQFPVWSTEGAKRVAGRWHRVGDEVIYASEHYSTALLEKLAYCNGVLPANQHFVEATIPAGVSYEVVTGDTVPAWDHPNCASARAFAAAWYLERRSAILFVPSVVARTERNIVINSGHVDFGRYDIEVGLETPVRWDQRLFLGPADE